MSGKILVIDDVATNRIVMKVKLASACYTVLQATGGRQGLIRARRDQPDLILLDVMMPDLDGFAVCKALKSDPSTAHIPVIMMTVLADSEARLRGLQAGADDFLTKPLDEMTLLARVRSLMRSQTSALDRQMQDQTREALGISGQEERRDTISKCHVGIITHGRRVAVGWQSKLKGTLGCEISPLTREAALAASKSQPDLFLIEAEADGPETALQIVAELRARPATRHAALMLLLPKEATHLAAHALDQGVNEVLVLPVATDELVFRLTTQLHAKHASDQRRAEMEAGLRLAVIDPLTGLFNRRYALNHLENIASRSQRTARDFAVIMLDFDHFKEVNDAHGHAIGDQVLAEIALRLREKLRAMDLIARLGGEEFLVVLPDTGQAQAERIAERIRRLIEATPILASDGETDVAVQVSASLGLAMGSLRDGDATTASLLEKADRALYAAKAEGRNRVKLADRASRRPGVQLARRAAKTAPGNRSTTAARA